MTPAQIKSLEDSHPTPWSVTANILIPNYFAIMDAGGHVVMAEVESENLARFIAYAAGLEDSHRELMEVVEAIVRNHTYLTPSGATNCRWCDCDMDHEGTFHDMHSKDCVIRQATNAGLRARKLTGDGT